MAIAKRRVVQVLSLLALHSSWGPELKWLCVPVLSCHSCALAWFACPVGVFVHYSAYGVFPYLAVGTKIRGHEFHYSRLQAESQLGSVMQLDRGVGLGKGRDGVLKENVLASYTHLHALGEPAWADGMIRAAQGKQAVSS